MGLNELSATKSSIFSFPPPSIYSHHIGLLIVTWTSLALPAYLFPTLVDIHTACLLISIRFLCKPHLFCVASLNLLFKIALPKGDPFLFSTPFFFLFIHLALFLLVACQHLNLHVHGSEIIIHVRHWKARYFSSFSCSWAESCKPVSTNQLHICKSLHPELWLAKQVHAESNLVRCSISKDSLLFFLTRN